MTWSAYLFISVHTCTHTLTHSNCAPSMMHKLQILPPSLLSKELPRLVCPPYPQAVRCWQGLEVAATPTSGLPSAGVVDRAVGPHLGGDVVSRGLGLREMLGSRSGPSFLAIPPLQQKCAWEIQWWTSNAMASWERNPKTPWMVWKQLKWLELAMGLPRVKCDWATKHTHTF